MMQSHDVPASSLSLSQTSSDFQFGDRNPAYYKVGTSGNALKCRIISAILWLFYLQISLFISIFPTAVGIISPVEFVTEASHFQYKLWENHDLIGQPVITYMYLCGQIYASCLSYISNHPS